MSTPHPDIGTGEDSSGSGGLSGLDREVRRARLAHAAHFDALVEIRDAQTLRLAALHEELRSKFSREPRLRTLFPAQLEAGFPPRLWLDNVSYVEMEPDPRTFRLVRQERAGHLVVAETRDLQKMVRDIGKFAAHRLVEQDAGGNGGEHGNGRTPSQMVMVWLAGFSFGVLSLLALGVLLGKINF